MILSSVESSLGVASGPGAHVHPAGVRYCVWAPDHAQVTVQIRRVSGGTHTLDLAPIASGYFAAEDPAGRPGDRYAFQLGDGAPLPDPVSRFQPDGVHGWSECVDPLAYQWRCATWQRPGWRGQTIYELHVGTFTPEGTFRAAIGKLEHVAALGVGAIELMPLADFPGGRNWGYDGVALYAPARCYGRPDDLRALIDAAHERGLAVILDVVYNHFGPDGNYLGQFAKEYFHPERHTPWGQSFNLDGPDSRPVRDFFVGNAVYWLDEFRIDGLRLDATHAISDESPRHLLAEIAERVHERGGFVTAEDERNSCDVLWRPEGGGARIDAVWADDFHHQVRVALTGVQEGYFHSYSGSAADLAETLEHGWFYRGQPYPFWRGQPRGEPGDHLAASAFVYCIENHDQAGNRARGERLAHLIGPASFRAASALLCLSPHPPLIFMGQEWAASTPFQYFTDHHGELGVKVSEGRRKEFASAGINQGLAFEDVPDPQAPDTFTRSKLAWDELRLSPHATVLDLYRECLRHRRAWLQSAVAERGRWSVEAFDRAVAIRYRVEGSADRLVVCSLSGDTRLSLANNAGLRPPDGCGWQLVLDSNASWLDSGGLLGAESATISNSGKGAEVETLVFGAPATVLLIATESATRELT